MKHSSTYICLPSVVLIGCFATQSSVVADRFRAEYDCDPEVRSIGGTSYEAEGCGYRATYTCGVTQGDWVAEKTCVRERGDDANRPTPLARARSMEAKSRVERRYDDKRQVQVVQSDFAPKPGVSMQFVGAPKVQLGDILFNLEMSRYDGQRPCDKLELLINDVPLAATNASSSPVGARVRFSAHFEFQQFKPLAQRFPSFGVRRCDFQLKLSEADVRLLQKFLLMYSDMAVEVQSAQEGTPAASPPPEGAISL